MKKREIVQAH